MNRRELLKIITGTPGIALLDPAVKVESDVKAGDLVVIETSQHILPDTADRIAATCRLAIPETVSVLVLSEGMTLRVERGVGRIQTPEKAP